MSQTPPVRDLASALTHEEVLEWIAKRHPAQLPDLKERWESYVVLKVFGRVWWPYNSEGDGDDASFR